MARSRAAHRPCNVCTHPDRALIEKARIAGAGQESLASRYGVSKDSIYRHMRNHMTDAARAAYTSEAGLRALADQAAADGISTLDRYRIANGFLMNQLQQAAQANDGSKVAAVSRAMFEGLRDVSKLTGEVLEHVGNVSLVQNNFYQSPDYLALQAMLVQALAPYPEAMRAVLAGLDNLESEAPGAPKLIEGRDLSKISQGD
jgi:hypothetical protein